MAMLRNNFIAVPEGHYDDLEVEFQLKENTKDSLRDSIRNEGFGVEDDMRVAGVFQLTKNDQPIGTITSRIVVRPFRPDGRPFVAEQGEIFPQIYYLNVFELVVDVESVNYKDTLLQVLREVLYGGRPMDGGRHRRVRKTKKRRQSKRKTRARRAKKN
jgi:hypothetical protein